jgi:hypothetical protein
LQTAAIIGSHDQDRLVGPDLSDSIFLLLILFE